MLETKRFLYRCKYIIDLIATFILLKCIDGKYLVMKYQNQPNLVQGASRLNGLYSDIIYMMYNNMRLGCDMPYSNWFINQLFTKNGLVADSINVQGRYSIQ